MSKKSNTIVLPSITYSIRNFIIYRDVKTAVLYICCNRRYENLQKRPFYRWKH